MSRQERAVKIPARQLQDGRFVDVKPSLIVESELRMVLNGEHLATASLLPGMEKEFVTGYLFGQGFIEGPDDIASIELEASTARITLFHPAQTLATGTHFRIVSGGGRTAFAETAPPRITSDFTLQKDLIFEAMNRIFNMGTLYKETEGAHAAGIFTPSAEPVCIVEDIGRHNCLDKAIGYALLQKIPCNGHFVVSTGRMSSEMVAKLCRAGFPAAATKTAVTDKGLKIAKRSNMTLIGFVRDTGMKIHTDMAVRIIAEPVMKLYTANWRITGL